MKGLKISGGKAELTTTQKQINELKDRLGWTIFVSICFGIFFFIILTTMGSQLNYFQSQLSHKADKICWNETYQVPMNHTCELYFYKSYCIDYPEMNYCENKIDWNKTIEECRKPYYMTLEKEVCEIR